MRLIRSLNSDLMRILRSLGSAIAFLLTPIARFIVKVALPRTRIALFGGLLATGLMIYASYDAFLWIMEKETISRSVFVLREIALLAGSFFLVCKVFDVITDVARIVGRTLIDVGIAAIFATAGVITSVAVWPDRAPGPFPTSGGIAFVTSESVPVLDVTALDLSHDYADEGRILELTLKFTVPSNRPVTIAIMSSGSMRINELQVEGPFYVSSQTDVDRYRYNYERSRIDEIADAKPFFTGRHGTSIDRKFPLSTVDTPWYDDSTSAVHTLTVGHGKVSTEISISLLARVRGPFSAASPEVVSRGSLGQMGCPSDLFDRSANYNGGEGLDSLVDIRVRDLKIVWTVPKTCRVTVQIGQGGANVAVTVNGRNMPDKDISVRGASKFPGSSKFGSDRVNLTLPETNWQAVNTSIDSDADLFFSSVWAPVGVATIITSILWLINRLLKRRGIEVPEI